MRFLIFRNRIPRTNVPYPAISPENCANWYNKYPPQRNGKHRKYTAVGSAGKIHSFWGWGADRSPQRSEDMGSPQSIVITYSPAPSPLLRVLWARMDGTAMKSTQHTTQTNRPNHKDFTNFITPKSSLLNSMPTHRSLEIHSRTGMFPLGKVYHNRKMLSRGRFTYTPSFPLSEPPPHGYAHRSSGYVR